MQEQQDAQVPPQQDDEGQAAPQAPVEGGAPQGDGTTAGDEANMPKEGEGEEEKKDGAW